MLNHRWNRIIETVEYAFQPIVNIHTGTTFGFEALLRGFKNAGFNTILDLFDSAFKDGCLYPVDIALRERAVASFKEHTSSFRARLFFNLDNRILMMPDYNSGNTKRILDKLGIEPELFVFELSERQNIGTSVSVSDMLKQYKGQSIQIALDDFGTGYSGLKHLYLSEPDFIKIDRFFINSIDGDGRKRLFVTNVVDMAHLMGIKVVAEGVETKNEFYACREIGCDYVQCYLVQAPITGKELLLGHYPLIGELSKNHRRKPVSEILNGYVELMTPVYKNTHIVDILSRFRENPEVPYFPVINEAEEPVGLISERTLKQYVYSPYGIAILKNKFHEKDLNYFSEQPPVLDISTRIEKILEYYVLNKVSSPIIITRDGRYIGVLTEAALLKILNEREIEAARDQNPLSRLPGNDTINSIMNSLLAEPLIDTAFVYFDFDNFKAFNDNYGFRQGDRALLLFADMLREYKNGKGAFIGHIGGDDFVMIVPLTDFSWKNIKADLKTLVDKFNNNTGMFYNRTDRERGSIFARDRSGVIQEYPLITVSAGVLCFRRGAPPYSLDKLTRRLSQLKKRAKCMENHISIGVVRTREHSGAAVLKKALKGAGSAQIFINRKKPEEPAGP